MQAQRSTAIKKWHILLFAAVLSILFVLGGYLYYRYQEEDIRRNNHRVLSTIGEMKANQLAWWYEDEIYDAAVFSRNPMFGRFVDEWLTSGSVADRTNLIDLLDVTADSHSYENILITDPRGELILSYDPDVVEIDSIVIASVLRAANEREIISTDLYKSSIHQKIYIDFLAPVVADQEEPIAVLVLRMDPNEYLYPYIRSWPVPTETAESIIFRRENDSVLFLNELRHKDDAVLRLRFPLTQTDIPAVQAVLGYRGIFAGKDYRGVEVLADVRSIPGTPWFIVSKIDKNEIYTELYFRAGVIISFVFLLILLLGAGLAYIYSNRQRNIYRELYNTEKELWESQEEFKTILYSIGDAVITTDTAGKIRNMNPTAEQLTGWYEPDAQGNLLKYVFKIINEETRNPVNNPVQKVLQEGQVVGLANHTILISKDGKEIPIADSGAPIRNEEGKVIGVVLVFRDQTAEREAANKLRESERRLSTLMSNLPGMAYRCQNDPQWTMEFVSDGCIDLTGYSRDELVENKTIAYADLIHPDDQQIVWDEVQNSLNSNCPFQITYRIRTADGSEKWVWEQGRGIFSEDEDLVALEGFITDITDRKRMEEALSESEYRYRTLFEESKDTVYIATPEGNFLDINSSGVKLFGYSSKEELLQTDIARDLYWDPLQREKFKRLLNEQSYVKDYELELKTKEGKKIVVLETSTVVSDSRGNIAAYRGIIRDITKFKQAEEALRQSEQQFRLITENVPDMIVVLDTEGKRLYVSPSYEPILGDPSALVGTDSFKEIHPDDREIIKRVFKETVKTGVGQQTEYRLLSKDGSIRIVESKGGVIRDEQGNVSQVIVVSRDVTEKKKLEKQLLRNQRMESIGLLVGGIAHDLNNVLAPIMLSMNIIKQKASDKKTQKLLKIVDTSAQRGVDLIKQVLSFARGIEGESTSVQIRHLISDVRDVLKRTIPKSISLKIDASKDLRPIYADATQIHQVLMNLCINARDAMPEGGILEIKATNIVIDEQYAEMNIDAKPGSYVQVSVSDTGTGIPPDVIGRIFDPFFTTKEEGTGTGLGLSTVHTIIKSNGGFVNVYSEEGKGTIFKVYLPAKETEEDVITKEKQEAPAGNGELILVVDDERAVRAITQTTLEANGYRVITAADGIKAVDLYEKNKLDIDLILMDLRMPNMDGYGAIRAIKKMNPKALFIAMSGLVQNGKSIKQDLVEYLHKPFTAETLLFSIYEMLKNKK